MTIALTLTSGCYAGRTASRKKVGYAVNAVGMVAGSWLLVDSRSDVPGCGLSCQLASSSGNEHELIFGGSMLWAATALMIVTMAVNVEPEPDQRPAAPAAQRPASAGAVITPGLAPTSVTLR